jgi:hypothetical protein
MKVSLTADSWNQLQVFAALHVGILFEKSCSATCFPQTLLQRQPWQSPVNQTFALANEL